MIHLNWRYIFWGNVCNLYNYTHHLHHLKSQTMVYWYCILISFMATRIKIIFACFFILMAKACLFIRSLYNRHFLCAINQFSLFGIHILSLRIGFFGTQNGSFPTCFFSFWLHKLGPFCSFVDEACHLLVNWHNTQTLNILVDKV